MMAAGVKQRRDDIQGLRAVGALLVATFHIWVGRVSGGVDVFFVVSGFLLVGSLARELAAKGAVDVLGFVARLVRRLLPSSLFVIAVVLATAPFWLPQTRWAPTMTHVLASAFYLENWYLAWTATDYLARDEVASPLQHYWAMSVQVQALLLLCLAMAATGFALRRADVDRARAGVLLLAGVFAASLAYSVYATATNQPVAYFNTAARLWEFAGGGLVAIALPRLRLSTAAQLVGGWLGLFLVLSCGVLLKVSTIFPGYAALWPTTGAALILLCGHADHPLSVRRLLSIKPLNWIGDISYALYLWHWPLLVLYLTVTYQTSVAFGPGAAILGASILLAWATTRFVEGPFRGVGDTRPWATILAGAAAVALISGGDIGWRVWTARATPGDRLARPDPARYPGAAVFDATYFAADGSVPIKPGPLWMKRDVSPVYARGCHQRLGKDEVLSCTFGQADAPYTLAVVGGSHSAHYIPALQLAIKGRPWRMITLTRSSCLLSTPGSGSGADAPSCARWNRKLMAKLIALKPDLIFTTATYGDARRDESVPANFIERWQVLNKHGITVAAIRDNPWFNADVPECVQVNGPKSSRCGIERAAALAPVNPLLDAPSLPNVHYLDLTRYICPGARCPVVAGNIVMYSDRHHFTNTFMRTLTPYLVRQLYPVMNKVASARAAPRPAVSGS